LTEPYRKIRSFVKREGRITAAQQHALDTLWQGYGIPYSDKTLSFTQIFGRHAPVIIDIGVGNGDSTFHHARQHPENNYIALEVHRPGVGRLLQKLDQYQLNHVRIINHDALDVFEHQIPENSVDEIFIFFADPWPKKRHHKRRLIQPTFIQLIKTSLKTNGRLFIATDWEDYAEHIIAVCDQDPELINLAGAGKSMPRPKWRLLTKYEQRGLNLDHIVRDFCYALR